MTTLTRRELLGSAAASAAAAVLTGAPPAARAAAPDPPTRAQPGDDPSFPVFIDASAALTGIKASLLRPDADPMLFPVKREYFARAKADPKFQSLIAVYQANLDPADPERKKAAAALLGNTDPGIRNLARSILLVWYFGAWYSWPNAAGAANASPSGFGVVNADAYAEGWIWRIAEAHAMGYSNFRFGHWSHDPSPALAVSTILTGGGAA